MLLNNIVVVVVAVVVVVVVAVVVVVVVGTVTNSEHVPYAIFFRLVTFRDFSKFARILIQ